MRPKSHKMHQLKRIVFVGEPCRFVFPLFSTKGGNREMHALRPEKNSPFYISVANTSYVPNPNELRYVHTPLPHCNRYYENRKIKYDRYKKNGRVLFEDIQKDLIENK